MNYYAIFLKQPIELIEKLIISKLDKPVNEYQLNIEEKPINLEISGRHQSLTIGKFSILMEEHKT